ncbi:DsrE family protein [Methylococcus sp. EFPC2]|uniref:DsrE family protein n=1 Tax=Methylococcus sp. EFPC2 TaxID=2812648 RepID=UPI0019686484|nr:DsrE family protein [Methylococcus sp. EFPC2]QSA98525.1 DsrE family protein [Methylococcus sp. EFPC2]
MSGASKSFLFVLRHTPLDDGCRAREVLDQVFSAAAFDQTVRILLLDDGVWQLHPGQPLITGHEPVTPLFSALSLYDVDTPWVEQESLDARGLKAEHLVVPARTLTRNELPTWVATHDIVIGC